MCVFYCCQLLFHRRSFLGNEKSARGLLRLRRVAHATYFPAAAVRSSAERFYFTGALSWEIKNTVPLPLMGRRSSALPPNLPHNAASLWQDKGCRPPAAAGCSETGSAAASAGSHPPPALCRISQLMFSSSQTLL